MALLAASTLLLFSFQNCSSKFRAIGLSENSSSALGSGANGANSNSNVSSSSSTNAPSTTTSSQSNLFAAPFTPAKTVTVCPSGCNYTSISQAASQAQDYELIKVQAGTYNECAILPATASHIWLEGVGGMAHMQGVVCGEKGAIVTNGQLTVIDNFEFSNLQIPCSEGMNAVGIRDQTGDLIVRNSYFHDSQGGILTGNTPTMNLTVLNSRFARLGIDINPSCTSTGPWFHDIYVGTIASFTFKNSIAEQNLTGNVVKTRAYKSTVECNQIENGYDSTYVKNGFLLDLPNGGDEQVDNNIIAQGPYTNDQTTMVEFGAEIGRDATANPTQALEMSHNILINDFNKGAFLWMFYPTSAPASLTNNTFVGLGTPIGGNYASSVVQSGDQFFNNRSSAGLPASGLPAMPAACTSPVGNVPVP